MNRVKELRRSALTLSLCTVAFGASADIIQDRRTDWFMNAFETEPEFITQHFSAVDEHLASLRVWTLHTAPLSGYPARLTLVGPQDLRVDREAHLPPDATDPRSWEGYLSFNLIGVRLTPGEQYSLSLTSPRGAVLFGLNRNDGPYGDAYLEGSAFWTGTQDTPYYASDLTFQLIAVPEPSTVALLGFGMAGLACWSRGRGLRQRIARHLGAAGES
ncbi:PEP-CTERM sorting domain-containing protein [Schlegelella sp. S2-27]|uniref:PEP-CTERM sorting domain-containing protein n=1 Tax=Caldimonas mangrovi TaxID=2944811 RepID=A0ABT0YJH8_9BURK|nr:PEP-CTERM sorting domain-containing protein [Caldimonas mangrovi]MCM5678875.1 PEP-CTERM sorting domain-containing protein [Caldimonas mangrovi]